LGFVVVSYIFSPCISLFRSIWAALHDYGHRWNCFDYCGMRCILLCIYHFVETFIACCTLEAHHDVHCFL
jgi:hypothetical protein